MYPSSDRLAQQAASLPLKDMDFSCEVLHDPDGQLSSVKFFFTHVQQKVADVAGVRDEEPSREVISPVAMLEDESIVAASTSARSKSSANQESVGPGRSSTRSRSRSRSAAR